MVIEAIALTRVSDSVRLFVQLFTSGLIQVRLKWAIH